MTELKAKPRQELGRKVSRLRKAGFMPAVIYGEGVPSQPIVVLYKDFEKAYRQAGESTLVALSVDGKPYNVLIHDIAHDPIRGTPLHADFYAVRMDKAIRTKVALEFINESPAVKNDGGVLVKVMKEVEVEAFPQDLPHELHADLTLLAVLEQRLLIKDIILPKGVKILAEPEEVIALVEAPRSEEELAELQKAAEPAILEVKTEQEVKTEAKAAKEEAEKVEKE